MIGTVGQVVGLRRVAHAQLVADEFCELSVLAARNGVAVDADAPELRWRRSQWRGRVGGDGRRVGRLRTLRGGKVAVDVSVSARAASSASGDGDVSSDGSRWRSSGQGWAVASAICRAAAVAPDHVRVAARAHC